MKKTTLLAVPLLLALLLVGCSTTPTAFDKTFAVQTTNYVTQVQIVTNVIPLFQTNTVIKSVTVTNDVGMPVPFFYTNFVTVVSYQTNLNAATNLVPVISLSPNDTTKTIAGTAGTIGNIFLPGTGALITEGILAAFGIFFGIRNRTLAGKTDVLSQAAGTLVQIIEAGRKVMATTPQGQAAANAFTSWMVSHQRETQTIGAISDLVTKVVNNEEAQKAAEQIQLLMAPPAPKA